MRSFAVKKLLLALSSLTLAAGIASAECKSIAILQAQAALGSTKEGKAADDELNSRLGTKAADLRKRQDDLKDIQDKLSRGGNTMSDTAKAALQKDLDTKTKSFNRDKQDFDDEANAEINKVKADLIEKMKKVLDQYQKEHGYCAIFDVSDPNTNVIAFSDEADITPQIIEAYDKAAASMPKTAPAKTPAASAAKPPAASPAKPPAAPPKPPATAPGK
jgi:Skp family chaperone for outer membrane proteins